jgi:hypothetical protein
MIYMGIEHSLHLCVLRKHFSMGKTCGQNMWAKHVGKTCGQNMWAKHVGKTCGQNMWAKTALFIRIDTHTTQNTD